MINVSNEYKQYVSTHSAFSVKNKIIVDGVEYLGDVLKTFPKISHSSTKICGSFPKKTVSFEIYDLNNELDFEGKEIQVYKGMMLNGTPYYVKQGVFIPKKENITTNISGRSITFNNVEDKTQFLEDQYTSELDWSDNQTHTGLEIVQEICTKKSLTLKNSNFAYANYQFKQPNFDETTTYREVLARLGEIGGEIVIFDYNGDLEFKSQYTTNDTISRRRYQKVSVEKTITINSIILGKNGINDDIKYPENMLDENRVNLKILDNPFVDLYRSEMIADVASHLIGITYAPFELDNFIDGFIYELNDVINVLDRNGNTLRAVIGNIESSSRLKSNIKLSKESELKTDYKIAGSVRESIKDVKVDVDHINNEVRMIASATDELEGRLQQAEFTLDTQGARIQVMSKNINEEGDVTALKTTSYELSEDGFIIDDGSGFKSVDDTTGKYYYDNGVMTGKYTKDGSVQKDMALFGKYYYGIDEDLDVENFTTDDAMFVAQKYTDANGEECFGHFYNGV